MTEAKLGTLQPVPEVPYRDDSQAIEGRCQPARSDRLRRPLYLFMLDLHAGCNHAANFGSSIVDGERLELNTGIAERLSCSNYLRFF